MDRYFRQALLFQPVRILRTDLVTRFGRASRFDGAAHLPLERLCGRQQSKADVIATSEPLQLVGRRPRSAAVIVANVSGQAKNFQGQKSQYELFGCLGIVRGGLSTNGSRQQPFQDFIHDITPFGSGATKLPPMPLFYRSHRRWSAPNNNIGSDNPPPANSRRF